MKREKTGVARYIKGTAMVWVHFPVDFKGVAEISCMQCRFFQRTSGRCALTGEISEYPGRYVGSACPLELEESNG